MLFVYLLVVVYTTLVCGEDITPYFYIWNDSLAFQTDRLYLSYNIDAQVLPNWKSATLVFDKRFNTLMRAISPAWVRIGGTQADHNNLKQEGSKNRIFEHGKSKNRIQENTYTMETFQDFCFLASQLNLNLTFGLNLLDRANGEWDPTNSEYLMSQILKSNQFSEQCRVHFELGNQPDLYYMQGYGVNESQVASAFITARKAIDIMDFKHKTYLWGPDVASPLYSGYFFNVLMFMPPTGVLYGVTYHHFYDRPDVANPDYSYAPLILDKFIDRATQAAKLVQTYQQTAKLILGASADYSGDGVEGISNTYLQGFMYLDSLGLAAYYKHSLYFKQSLFGTKHSSLLELTPDQSTVSPTPAYWITLLYKRLISNRVLTVTGITDRARTVRMYAHCQNGSTNGSAVLYFMNLNTSKQEIRLENNPIALSPQYWYLFSTPTPDLASKEVLLNGQKLSLLNNTTLPSLSPLVTPPSESITLPGRQYGFVLFPNADVAPCKGGG